MDVILIAAVTADGLIARDDRDAAEWSGDRSLFRRQTLGWPVIMGSRTHRLLGSELEGRRNIVVHRRDDPARILAGLNSERCFVIGGSRTNTRFAPYLTHLYLTIHPLVFGRGLPLFHELDRALELELEKLLPLAGGLCQFQYRVRNSDNAHNP